MLRRTSLIIFIVSFLLFILGGVYSCTYDACVYDITFGDEGNPGRDTVVVTDTTILLVSAVPTFCVYSPPSLLPACYATTKAPKWKNEHRLDSASFALTLDRALIVETDTLLPQSNILLSSSFSRYARFQNENRGNNIRYKLRMSTALIKALAADTGFYLATFSCRTVDGKAFSKVRCLQFRN